MAADDTSGARAAGPVVLRIKLRYDDIDTMVQKFACNVGKSGLFLPSKSIQPIGTEVKFELRLSNDTPVLVGLGRVKHVKPPDPAQPKAAFGMAIELMRVSREGREVIIKMLERRRALGLPEVAIPFPEDVDAARRREGDSQPRVDTSGIVREAMRDFASAPVAEQVLSAPVSGPVAVAKVESAPVAKVGSAPVAKVERASSTIATKGAPGPIATPRADSGAIAIATSTETPPATTVARESASLLTAPRQGSGAIPAATSDGSSGRRFVAALAPEPAKAKRPRAADLLARANELADRLATVDVPGLDAQVDVERALVRARALAGSDLDGELANLRESAAAPLEISIEAASAELARQLGGKAITKRDRSAKVATPVAMSLRAESSSAAIVPPNGTAGDGFVVKTRAPTEASPSAVIAAVSAPVPAVIPAAPIEAAPIEVAPAAPIEVAPAAPIEAAAAADDDPANEYAREEKTRIPSGDDQAFLLTAITTTHLDPDDVLEVPVEEPVERRSFAPVPDDQLQTSPGPPPRSNLLIDDHADEAMLRRALEGSSPALQLDESDLEAVEDDRGESTHIGAFPIDPHAFGNHGFPTVPDDLADKPDRQLADADAEADEDLAEIQASAAGDPAPQPYAIQPYANEYAGRDQHEQPDQVPEEISDLDVLAEADAGDADLLTADGERDREASQADAAASADPAPGYPVSQDADYAEPDAAAQYAEPDAAAQHAEQGGPYVEQGAYVEQGGYVEQGEQGAYSEQAAQYGEAPEADAYAAPQPIDDGAPVFPDELPGFEPPVRPSQDDFAARLDLDDEPDEDERRNFPTANPRPRSASRSGSYADSPAHAYEPQARAADVRHSRPPSSSEFPDPPSESHTFAEPVPQPSLQLAPRHAGEDFDEPHGFTQNTPVPARSRTPSRGPQSFEQPARSRSSRAPQLLEPEDDPIARALQSLDEPSHPHVGPAPAPAAPPTEDLEDALAALDVDLDPQIQQQRRARRQSARQRPLPGLPIQRVNETGPSPVAPRPSTGASPTVSPPIVPRTTGANVVARPAGKPPVARGGKPTAPPPIPAAARRSPATTPPPIPIHLPPKRATTDDGILIDFDEDPE